jgi:hypothetical protein
MSQIVAKMIEKLVILGHKHICVDISLAPLIELANLATHYGERVEIILVMNGTILK